MYACAGGHEDVVRVLLEAGANVEVLHTARCTLCTPHTALCTLHTAHCARCTLHAARCTVCTVHTAHCTPQDHNENGHTPLMEAASAGHCGVAKVS